MVINEQIKSGADIEILLGENYITQILQTFYDSKSIPESFTLDNGYTIGINPMSGLRFLDDNNRDIRLDIPLDFFDENGDPVPFTNGTTNFFAKLNFIKDLTEDGNVKSLKIQIEIVDFANQLQNVIDLANTQLDPDEKINRNEVLVQLNENLGQEYPLNLFGKDKQIRGMQTKKFADDNQTEKAIGIYMNLRLQKGPEDFNVFENQIDLNNAVNFLPENQAIAFGMNEDMFDRLSSDIKQGFAEEKTKGEGDWYYPLKDGKKVKGKISSIKVKPWQVPIMNGSFFSGQFENKNALLIVLKGEVFVDEVDIKPDFTVQITLTPKIVNGSMEWDSNVLDTDIDLTFWENLKLSFTLGFIIGWVLAIFTGPLGLVVGGVIGGITMLLTDPIADAIGEGIVGDLYKKYIDTSLFDAIPDRVTTITRRRNPFYTTDFQVVTGFAHILIDPQGFSLAGTASTEEEYHPIDHVVFKNEIRHPSFGINAFQVRVKDWNKIDADVIDTFERADSQNKPELFTISLDQIIHRKRHSKFHPKMQFNWPVKIDKENNAIERIKVISSTERTEIEDKHIIPHLEERAQWFEANLKSETMDKVVEKLEKKLGRPLTDNDNKEKKRRYNEKFKEWIEEEENKFRRGPLKSLYKRDALAAATLDMSPHEYGVMQQRSLMAMVWLYKRIRIKKSDTFYYRAKANRRISDNLAEFPEYESLDFGT